VTWGSLSEREQERHGQRERRSLTGDTKRDQETEEEETKIGGDISAFSESQ